MFLCTRFDRGPSLRMLMVCNRLMLLTGIVPSICCSVLAIHSNTVWAHLILWFGISCRPQKLSAGAEGAALHVPALQVHLPHAQTRHIPPRHQAGEHPHPGTVCVVYVALCGGQHVALRGGKHVALRGGQHVAVVMSVIPVVSNMLQWSCVLPLWWATGCSGRVCCLCGGQHVAVDVCVIYIYKSGLICTFKKKLVHE